MNVFLLVDTEHEPTDGHIERMVVSHYSSSDARILAAENAGLEGSSVWLDAVRTTCVLLRGGRDPAVIVAK